MNRACLILPFLLFATAANAQVVATAGHNIVVAHDGQVELFDETAHRVWMTDGVAHPSSIATSADRIAVADAFANELRIVDIANGQSRSVHTNETPVAAVFLGHNVYVLSRDASRLDRIGGESVTLAADPAFLRVSNGRIYVYSRLDGIVQEIATDPLRVLRQTTIAPFASDFEVDGKVAYLVFPHEAKVRSISLDSMQRTGEVTVGAVPVDLAVGTRLAIADPSAKRVWNIEGNESTARAFARGFIRGFLGLALFEGRSVNSDLPTGVDRVATRGTSTIAYDSTTRTLYRLDTAKPQIVAADVAPEAFALTAGGIALWQNGALRLIH